MSSRFFGGPDSDTSSEESSEEESEEEEQQQVRAGLRGWLGTGWTGRGHRLDGPRAPPGGVGRRQWGLLGWRRQQLLAGSDLRPSGCLQVTAPAGATAKVGAFMKGGDDSDSDEDKKRVVRSHRDKKWDQMTEAVASMKNHIKIHDWLAVTDDFDKLNKLLQKAKAITDKEGIPKFYFQALLHLDTANGKALEDKDAKKKMSPSNAKALNSMKQKLRKITATYKDQLDAAKAAGDADEEPEAEAESESEPESSSEDEAPSGAAAFLKKPAAAAGKASAFMKEAPAAPKEKAKPAKPVKEAAAPLPPQPQPTKPQGPKPIAQYNEADIDKRLDLILQSRGRKGTDRKETISILTQLADVTKRPSKLVELLSHVITFQFDLHMSMLAAMPVPVWKAVFDVFARILKTLVDNPDLKIEVMEGSTVVDTVQMTIAEQGDADDEFLDSGVTQMTSNVLSYLERLDDEFYKSLQLQDPHRPEYVARLKDEVPLVNLMQDTLAYIDSKEPTAETMADAARVSSRIVEHIYYREQSLFDTATENAAKRKVQLHEEMTKRVAEANAAEVKAAEEAERLAEEEEEAKAAKEEKEDEDDDDDDDVASRPETELRKAANAATAAAAAATAEYNAFMVPRAMDLRSEMDALARRIYAHGSDRARTRTLLCQVYQHSLHGRYAKARDMLLMSHLGDVVNGMDISTQILYNRALVRMGLCAFTDELVVEAHAALMELAAGARIKELLAQAVSSQRFGERNPEQERLERRRLVPYHMHINLELVEAVHLFCAMLLELPNLAHNAFDPKRRSQVVSKTFRRLLDQHERQVFNGPPENTRDFVMGAAQLLLDGQWEMAADSVCGMAVWDLLPNAAATRAFIRTKMQSEGLRAYLISSYPHYDSLSLPEIAGRFGLGDKQAHALISKMMLDGTVHACWDQPTATVVVQRTEPTKLQFLALQFADKCSQLVESNERILDSRTGSYGYKYEQRDSDRTRRPWVERSDRGGHYGGGYNRPWQDRRGGDAPHEYKPWQDRRDGGGRGGAAGGGGGRGWGGRSDRQQLENYKGRRF
jgi:translation initiation factor 3 subunit C